MRRDAGRQRKVFKHEGTAEQLYGELKFHCFEAVRSRSVLSLFLVLRNLGRLERFLGEGGIAVLQKVFGIILLAIAVKLFTSNIQHLF